MALTIESGTAKEKLVKAKIVKAKKIQAVPSLSLFGQCVENDFQCLKSPRQLLPTMRSHGHSAKTKWSQKPVMNGMMDF